MSYKGRFKPKHYNKYKGDPTKIVYRSLWERRFMKYCDDNPNILRWSSEEVIIPYRTDDGNLHRYFPDFMIEYKVYSHNEKPTLNRRTKKLLIIQ